MGTDYAFYAQRSMLIKGKVAYIKKDLVSVQWPAATERIGYATRVQFVLPVNIESIILFSTLLLNLL